jgi:excisionase family DNA binding protein
MTVEDVSADGSETPAEATATFPSWDGPDDEMLTPAAAAALLTVKKSTLLAWARDGRIPVHRLGPKHLRWTRPLLRQIRDRALDSGRF